MEKEKTHTVKMALEDGAGEVTFLLTITATTSGDTKTDMATFKLDASEKQAIARKYVSILNSMMLMMLTYGEAVAVLLSRSANKVKVNCLFIMFIMFTVVLFQAITSTPKAMKDIGWLQIKGGFTKTCCLVQETR